MDVENFRVALVVFSFISAVVLILILIIIIGHIHFSNNDTSKINKLEKEIDNLKYRVRFECSFSSDWLVKEYYRLKSENEKLKSEINRYRSSYVNCKFWSFEDCWRFRKKK